MKNIILLIVSVIFILTGCSENQGNNDKKIRSVNIDLSKENNLDDWKLSLSPKTDLVGQQVYDLEFQYIGNDPIKNVTVYYRIDTKEKLSASVLKADSKTIVSSLDKDGKNVLSELILPSNTPVSVEVDWLNGSFIEKGIGTFNIQEVK